MAEDSDGGKEENLCPVCMEELDITDQHFKPCDCGYQVRRQETDIFYCIY
jgi:hypothetical protein